MESSSMIRDQTQVPCIGSVVSYSLDHQGSPQNGFFPPKWFFPPKMIFNLAAMLKCSCLSPLRLYSIDGVFLCQTLVQFTGLSDGSSLFLCWSIHMHAHTHPPPHPSFRILAEGGVL